MLHRTCLGLALVCSMLPLAAVPVAGAEEVKAQKPNSAGWCLTATINAQPVHRLSGIVTEVDAVNGVFKLQVEERVALKAPDAGTAVPASKSSAKVVEVAVTPQTTLQRAIVDTVPAPAAVGAPDAPPRTTIRLEAAKLADIRVGQVVAVALTLPLSVPRFEKDAQGVLRPVPANQVAEFKGSVEANYVVIAGAAG